MIAAKAASPTPAATGGRARDVNRRAAPIASNATRVAVKVQVVETVERDFPLTFLEDCFVARAVARSTLVQSGDMGLHDAVDGLQAAADQYGLIVHHGQDAVQAVMSRAFAWRALQDG